MKKDLEKEQAWKEKLENYKNSGLSYAQWCKKNNEKLHVFKYWQQKLKKQHPISLKFEELKDPCSYPIEIRKREIFLCFPQGCDQKILKDSLLVMEKGTC